MSQGPSFAYFQGKIVPIEEAKVSVMTHALNYGTGAFGGIRAYWNEEHEELYIFRPLDHFKRVLDSGKILLMNLPYTPESMLQILLDLLHQENYHQDVYVRPLIYASSAGIGVRLHNLDSDFTMFALPFGSYIPNEEGARATFSSWRRIDDNEIAEGSAENFFMIRNGVAVTPPSSANILEGITRRTIIQLLQEEMGLDVEIRQIDRTEVFVADEIFFCGTGVQVVAVTEVDHRAVGTGKIGPVVSQLRDLYFNVVRGNVAQYGHWNVPVYREVVTQPDTPQKQQ